MTPHGRTNEEVEKRRLLHGVLDAAKADPERGAAFERDYPSERYTRPPRMVDLGRLLHAEAARVLAAAPPAPPLTGSYINHIEEPLIQWGVSEERAEALIRSIDVGRRKQVVSSLAGRWAAMSWVEKLALFQPNDIPKALTHAEREFMRRPLSALLAAKDLKERHQERAHAYASDYFGTRQPHPAEYYFGTRQAHPAEHYFGTRQAHPEYPTPCTAAAMSSAFPGHVYRSSELSSSSVSSVPHRGPCRMKERVLKDTHGARGVSFMSPSPKQIVRSKSFTCGSARHSQESRAQPEVEAGEEYTDLRFLASSPRAAQPHVHFDDSPSHGDAPLPSTPHPPPPPPSPLPLARSPPGEISLRSSLSQCSRSSSCWAYVRKIG